MDAESQKKTVKLSGDFIHVEHEPLKVLEIL
jgi:hypothetical protein